MKTILVLLVAVSLLIPISVNAQSTLPLQQKCSEGAHRFLERHSFKGIINHVSHYNKKLDRCFIRIDYFLDSEDVGISLDDVFEWKSIGSFYRKQDGEIIRCYVGNKSCETRDEFEALIKPYMEE